MEPRIRSGANSIFKGLESLSLTKSPVEVHGLYWTIENMIGGKPISLMMY